MVSISLLGSLGSGESDYLDTYDSSDLSIILTLKHRRDVVYFISNVVSSFSFWPKMLR